MVFFQLLSSSLEYSFFIWNLSIFRPYLAVFSHWIYTIPLWQNLLTFRSTIVFLLFCFCFYMCEIWFKISMCICSVCIPSLEYSLFTWNLSIFRFNLAVLLPLWQNLLTFRSMIVFFVLQVCHLRQTFKPTAESCIFVHIILQECKMWPKFICTFFPFATKFQQILS